MDAISIEPKIENSNLQLMTASEAAKFLMVTPRKVYRMMKDGEIPTVKFGGSVRIRQVDLENFISSHLNG
jgi:excisionase family DNA binding protein